MVLRAAAGIPPFLSVAALFFNGFFDQGQTTTMLQTEAATGCDCRKILIAILWPSFVSAGVALVLLYIILDPIHIADAVGLPGSSRIAIYSLSFIFFWFQAILASVFCLLFIAPTRYLNPKKKDRSQ